jgi:uncharacterized protein YfiM (DUF2279 family)
VRKNLTGFFLLLSLFSYAQDSIQLRVPAQENYKLEKAPATTITKVLKSRVYGPTTVSQNRKWIVGIGTVAAYATSFIYLNEAWYKGYPRSSFHTFNDAGEWKQMDKVGHAWTAYNTGRGTTGLWRWAGVHEKNSILMGSGTSLLYMLAIEYLDGRSAGWGWSWTDVAADFSGSILFSAQELGWKQQKIQLKFSSHKKIYEQPLNERANNLFGKSFYERLLKDYNTQTYWLSFNISSFLKKKNVPDWLNISFGYGAEGMFGGYENIAYDKTGAIIFDRRDIERYRQWYFAPDVDFTKIKTSNKLLRTVFYALNAVKFPSPALEFSKGKLHGKLLQF